MTEEKVANSYYEYIEKRIAGYTAQADQNMWIQHSIRIGLILIGAGLPFVVAQDNWQLLAGFLGFVVAALSGLDGYIRAGEKWQNFRSSQMGLQRKVQRYERALAEIPADQRTFSNTQFKLTYDNFVEGCEEVMSAESEKFWKIAISEKKPSPKNEEGPQKKR